jgi:hypothetical protein
VNKMTANNSNVVAGAKSGLKNMKTEIANELGLSNYENMDKGNLTARQNGYVGGYMTKRLVEMAEQQLSGKTNA